VNSLEDLPPISDFVPDAGVVEALEAGLRVVPDATTATADVNDSGLRLQERHTP